MGIWAGQESWSVETRDAVDLQETPTSSTRDSARSIPVWTMLGILLASIILFAIQHPS